MEFEIVAEASLVAVEDGIAFWLVVNQGKIDDLAHFTVTPAVDGLLAVADDHAHVVVGQVVVNQRHEILPLQYGGVLKLVDEEVLEMFSDPFIDERHGEIAHDLVDALVEFGDMDNLFLTDVGFHL